MPLDLAIKNGKIVTATHTYCADIGIDKGRIVAIAEAACIPPADRVIDAQGRFVLPGVVDPHVHLSFLGPFELLSETETRAGAAGGVTTMGVYMPYKLNEGIIKPFEDAKRTYEANARCDAFFHAFVRDEVGLEDIPRAPQVGITSFKFSIGYKGAQARLLGIPELDDGFFFEGFEKVGRLGRSVLAAVHAENIDIALRLRDRLIKEGRRDLAAWYDSRPNFVEAECMNRCIFLTRIAGCPLYVVHMTIGEGVEIVSRAKAEGAELTAETCPQYLTHSSEEPVPLLRDNPALGNVNPPLRNKADNLKLWQGLRDGVIACIGSDHSVATREEKGTDIWNAPMGLGNLTEMILPVMLSEGVNKGRITLEKVVEVCCTNPARVFGIYPQKGALAVGSDADIVLIDLKKKVKVNWDMLHSRCDWNIYDGWEFTGWPAMTILRGQTVVEDGKVKAEKGTGRYLARQLK